MYRSSVVNLVSENLGKNETLDLQKQLKELSVSSIDNLIEQREEFQELPIFNDWSLGTKLKEISEMLQMEKIQLAKQEKDTRRHKAYSKKLDIARGSILSGSRSRFSK